MTLRAKPFEKRLWAQVKEHDLRRRLSLWRRLLLALNHPLAMPHTLRFFRVLLLVVLPAVLLNNRNSVAGNPEKCLAAFGLWALLTAHVRVNFLLHIAEIDPQYRTLWMLPCTADQVFMYVLRRIWVGTLWDIADFLVLYGFIGLMIGSVLSWVMAIFCAGLQGSVSMALAVLMVRIRFNFEKAQVVMFFLVLMVMGVLPIGSKALAQFVTSILYVFNPFGWINAVYLEGCLRANGAGWLGLLPVVAIAATIPWGLRRLRRLNASGFLRESRIPKVAELQNEIDSTAAPNWSGLVERLLAKFLDPQERSVAETMLIGQPRWSRFFYGLLIYVALFLAANSLIHFESGIDLLRAVALNVDRRVAESILGCIASGVLFACMLLRGISLFTWWVWPARAGVGTRGITVAEVRSFSTFRLLPLNYWDAVKVVAKVNTVLILLVVPLAVMVSLAPVFQLFQSFGWPGTGIGIITKCLAAVWVLSVFVPSTALTAREDGLRYWLAFLAMAAMVAALLALSIALFMSPKAALDFVLIGLLLPLTAAWVTYWGLRYSRNSA